MSAEIWKWRFSLACRQPPLAGGRSTSSMQPFSNGFQEADDELPAPAAGASSPRSTAAVTSSNQPTATVAHADTLDLTEDSPEPPEKPLGGEQGQLEQQKDRRTLSGSSALQNLSPPKGSLTPGQGGQAQATRSLSATTNGFGQFASNGSSSSPRNTKPGHFAAPRHAHSPAGGTSRPAPTSFQQIPVISSASSARTPSAHLPVASTSAASGGFMQPVSSAAAAHACGTGFSTAKILQETQAAIDGNKPLAQRIPPAPSPAAAAAAAAAIKRESSAAADPKGKGREDYVDLTADDGQSDDEVVFDETPVCIGEVRTLGLITVRADEIVPPEAPSGFGPNGTPWTPEQMVEVRKRYEQEFDKYMRPLKVQVFRDERQVYSGSTREMLRLITPEKREPFGFIDYRVANTLGPLLGDGMHGNGWLAGGNGKVWCEAEIDRQGEINVSFSSAKISGCPEN